jgi:hypothetical protein
MHSTYQTPKFKAMAQTCEINARLRFLQLYPKVNYADIVKQPGKVAKNKRKVLNGEEMEAHLLH